MLFLHQIDKAIEKWRLQNNWKGDLAQLYGYDTGLKVSKRLELATSYDKLE